MLISLIPAGSHYMPLKTSLQRDHPLRMSFRSVRKLLQRHFSNFHGFRNTAPQCPSYNKRFRALRPIMQTSQSNLIMTNSKRISTFLLCSAGFICCPFPSVNLRRSNPQSFTACFALFNAFLWLKKIKQCKYQYPSTNFTFPSENISHRG